MEVLLGFKYLIGLYTGCKIADILIKVLNFYNITKDQILTIINNNIAPNIKLYKELEVALKLINKEIENINYIPYLAYIIQLALKKLIKYIKIKPRNSKVIIE